MTQWWEETRLLEASILVKTERKRHFWRIQWCEFLRLTSTRNTTLGVKLGDCVQWRNAAIAGPRVWGFRPISTRLYPHCWAFVPMSKQIPLCCWCLSLNWFEIGFLAFSTKQVLMDAALGNKYEAPLPGVALTTQEICFSNYIMAGSIPSQGTWPGCRPKLPSLKVNKIYF